MLSSAAFVNVNCGALNDSSRPTLSTDASADGGLDRRREEGSSALAIVLSGEKATPEAAGTDALAIVLSGEKASSDAAGADALATVLSGENDDATSEAAGGSAGRERAPSDDAGDDDSLATTAGGAGEPDGD